MTTVGLDPTMYGTHAAAYEGLPELPQNLRAVQILLKSGGRRISKDKALERVAGYALFNRGLVPVQVAARDGRQELR